jgi:hypothetical protein
MPLWKWLLLGLIVVPLFVWGCDRVQMIHWVGSTDLEVEFSIAHGAAGTPVPRARVEIHQDGGGFYEDQDEREFVLIADEEGFARRECRRSMCFGTRSGLGFTDTFAVHLPKWRYRVVADGFETIEWVYLDGPVRPAGPGKAKLGVPVTLNRKPAEPGAALRRTVIPTALRDNPAPTPSCTARGSA